MFFVCLFVCCCFLFTSPAWWGSRKFTGSAGLLTAFQFSFHVFCDKGVSHWICTTVWHCITCAVHCQLSWHQLHLQVICKGWDGYVYRCLSCNMLLVFRFPLQLCYMCTFFSHQEFWLSCFQASETTVSVTPSHLQFDLHEYLCTKWKEMCTGGCNWIVNCATRVLGCGQSRNSVSWRLLDFLLLLLLVMASFAQN